MPEYHAVDVIATLSIAPLQNTLKIEQAEAIAGATALRERPIGADGSERWRQQFIGDYEDMPLFMVEAGEHIERAEWDILPSTELDRSRPAYVADDTTIESVDSPLTSLGTTPNRSFEQSEQQNTPGQGRWDSSSSTAYVGDIPARTQSFADFSEVQTTLPQQSAAQALMLTLKTCSRSHLSETKSRKELRAMKVEIFVNGELANIEFINPRRGYIQHDAPTVSRFAGTRITRHSEKPWTYRSAGFEDQLYGSDHDAQSRWNGINKSLEDEAQARGVDMLGISPPTAEYLKALAQIALPERLQEQAGLGVVDLVITVGSGQKLGPAFGLFDRPTRMNDPRLFATDKVEQRRKELLAASAANTNQALVTQIKHVDGSSAASDGLPTRLDISRLERATGLRAQSDRPDSSMPPPDLPARRLGQGKSLSIVASPHHTSSTLENTPDRARPTEEQTKAFAKELGITLTKGMVIPSFTNNRGKVSTNRSLAARLSDIIRMTTGSGKDRAIEEVKQQFPAKNSRQSTLRSKPRKSKAQVKSNTKIDSSSLAAPDSPTRKKIKLDTQDARGTSAAERLPRKERGKVGEHRRSKSSIIAFQNEGVSQTDDIVKAAPTAPWRQGAVASLDAPLGPSGAVGGPGDLHSDSSPTKASRSRAPMAQKAPRTRNHKKDAIVAFELPELCLGSAVTYAAGDIQRKVPAERPGDFKEEELVVGMRWVVI